MGKNQVMHLFPRDTSRAECGVYGIMTNQIEYVTCPNCLAKSKERTKGGMDDRRDGNGSVGNGDSSGTDRADFSVGLADNHN